MGRLDRLLVIFLYSHRRITIVLARHQVTSIRQRDTAKASSLLRHIAIYISLLHEIAIVVGKVVRYGV